MKTYLYKIICLFAFSAIIFNSSLCSKPLMKTGSIPVGDSLELVNFWTALDGPNWTPIQWDLTQPISTWGGIVLDATGDAILQINLGNSGTGNNLSGELPNIAITTLERLDLRSGNISGPIPNLQLPELKYLILDNNNLTSEIPNFDGLPNLEDLYIASNELEGLLPDFNLPALKFLNISGNNWTGPITNFSNLPNLEFLYFFSNASMGGDLPNFENLQNLKTIWGNNSNITGSLPDFDLPNLEIIWLKNNQISGSLPNFDLPSLKELELSENEISGQIPSYNLPSLETINLQFNQIAGVFPGDMVLPNVVEFIAGYNEIGGELPLLTLPSLELLNLNLNQLQGAIPDWNLPNLKDLQMGQNMLSGSIPDFTGLPSLELLLINGNELTGQFPDLSGTPLLRAIFGGNNIFSGDLPGFSSLPNLLNISFTFNELSGTLPEFANSPLLRSIDVSYNNMVGTIPDLSDLPIFNFDIRNNNFIGCFPTWLCDVPSSVETQWNPGLPDGGSADAFNNFCVNPATQIGLSCDDGDPATTGETIQADCSCATTNLFTNFISGRIFIDTLENCAYDNAEIPLMNWILSATDGENTFYGTSDLEGNYKLYTDTGSYVLQVAFPSTIWTLCPNIQGLPLDFTDPADTLVLDIPVGADVLCPIMTTDVGVPFLRRCFPNDYTVNYCNNGSTTAEDAYIEVSFDEFMDINFSSPPWDSQDGQVLTFNLGDVAASECGSIVINVTPNCDSIELGQTVCVQSQVFPDSVCAPANPLWDGSSTVLSGRCETDSVTFIIPNEGDSDMASSLSYIIIEDDLILRSGNFMIPAGGSDSTTVEANGATFRMQAEQSAFHPGMSIPTIAVEGCVDNGGMSSTGFVNIFSEDDVDPFISIDCNEAIGSYDPNDKQGFPRGLGPDHWITDDTEIEYLVRFQNTGTDTAFTVVIKDVISEFLDPMTIRMGAASHSYTWDLVGNGVLEVTFDDIMLPDSNVNVIASQGFFKFKIRQAADNPPGTEINNQVAIFFDFNQPIFTNITDHTIELPQVFNDTVNTVFCEEHWFYEEDTEFDKYSILGFYELYQNNVIRLAEPSVVEIDTVLFNGTAYDGVVYEGDTTLVYNNTNTSGCDSTTYINISVLTNTFEGVGNQQIKLYPNPTKENVHLLLAVDDKLEITQVGIYNQLGQLVKQQKVNQLFAKGKHMISIKMNDLPSGLYYVSVEGPESKIWTNRLLKN